MVFAGPGMHEKREIERPAQRYHELDSLRGLAALTVVFHHFRSMWGGAVQARWLNIFSPFTAGREAVMLFFLLSGFVLATPYLRGKGRPYWVYLRRRVVRIYGPYLFALTLALAAAAHWHGALGYNAWADLTWNDPISLRIVLDHLGMVANYDWVQINTAFWSLVIEMRISIIFPLLLLGTRRLRPAASLGLAATLLLGASLAARWLPGYVQSLETISFASIFICGIVLAMHVEQTASWYQRLGQPVRVALALASAGLYLFGHHAEQLAGWNLGGDIACETAGAAGIMIFAMHARTVRDLLHQPAAKLLGRLSFSLYLVHGTVLFALAHGLGTRIPIAAHFILYMVGSLLAAWLFCLWVEEPFLRLSSYVLAPGERRRRNSIPALSRLDAA